MEKTGRTYLLQNISSSLNGVKEKRAALRILIKEICEFYYWNYGEVWLPDQTNQQLQFFTAWDKGSGIYDHYKKFTAICKFAKGVGLIGKVWESGKLLWFDNIGFHKEFIRTDAAQKAGFHSAFAFSIQINDNYSIVLAFFLHKKNDEDDKQSAQLTELSEDISAIIKKYFSIE